MLWLNLKGSRSQRTGENLAAEQAGLPAETQITNINGVEYLEFQGFQKELSCMSPGDRLNITAGGTVYPVTLGSNPDSPGKPLLGVDGITNDYQLKAQYKVESPKWRTTLLFGSVTYYDGYSFYR